MSTTTLQNPTSVSTTNAHIPTAEYLRSRASALTRIMLTAFEDILSIGHDGDSSAEANDPASTFDRSHVNTAARQTAVDVATTKIVRAAEEYMVLTRTMKELWLFGGPDTLVDEETGKEDEEKEEREVVEGMRKWLIGMGRRLIERTNEQEDGQNEPTPMSTG